MIGPKRPRPTPLEEASAYELVTMRDLGVCVKCRRTYMGMVSRDHRQNRHRGNTRASNLQLLCGTGTTGCHGWKTHNPHAATISGYSVPSWAEPTEWPARRWADTGIGTLEQIWCLYDDEGRWERISDLRAVLLMEGVA